VSILDRVREKFQTPMSGTSKTSGSPSAAFAGTQDRHLKSYSPSSAGSAGATPMDVCPVVDDARANRLREATQMLRGVPSRHSAFIAGQECGNIVPVTIVIRTAQGMVTGDLVIPKDRWDPWLFLQFLRDQDQRPAE
jgi:hypothetical protein